ncbi:MAG: hypothetical protein GX921_08490 [Bacteroidales bacterium]|nr:hypothetical protein [Bacteroidales bacterium]
MIHHVEISNSDLIIKLKNKIIFFGGDKRYWIRKIGFLYFQREGTASWFLPLLTLYEKAEQGVER